MQKPRNAYKTHWYNKTPKGWFAKPQARKPGVNDVPPVIKFEASSTSRLPTVRIFLGTEPGQERAQRVFVYSVAKHRNPKRNYEIHLMSNIKDIDRTDWKTGFTNYRYAIPTWAGGKGRAIYNDVDQIYVTDPGELFDFDMQGRGTASISIAENSVMLIDCEKMLEHWNLDAVRAGKGHKHFKDVVTQHQLWQELPGQWNARDGEYPVSESKCIHYTTLHTQPWKPFQDELRYAESPVSDVWFALETEADKSRFLAFDKAHPSSTYRQLLQQYQLMHQAPDPLASGDNGEVFDGKNIKRSADNIGRLITQFKAATVLDYGSGKGMLYKPFPGEPADSRFKSHPSWGSCKVICYDPGYAPFREEWTTQTDGVISTDVLEHIPVEDLNWILDEILGKAKSFVYLIVACYPAIKNLPNGENAHCTVELPEWWRDRLQRQACGFPHLSWVLGCEVMRLGRKQREYFSSHDFFKS
jgi:hypothetical protein